MNDTVEKYYDTSRIFFPISRKVLGKGVARMFQKLATCRDQEWELFIFSSFHQIQSVLKFS